jgi:spore germination protein GerM
MEDRKRFRSLRQLPLGVLVGLSAVALLSGGAAAWFTWNSISTRTSVADFPDLEVIEPETVTPEVPTADPGPTTADPAPDQTAVAPTEQTGQVFWLQDTGTSFELVAQSIELPEDSDPATQVETALTAMLAGPSGNGLASTVPADTELNSVRVDADGIHVDLSADYTFGGGSSSMVGRLGQVVYTATMVDPGAPVWIEVDGEPLTLLGGEGIEVSQPMTREAFDQNFSL